MKIILSRKGFDSSSGGYPSPITDGKMLSLPIPRVEDKLRYSEIHAPNGKSYAEIMMELGADNRITGKGAHLDPDLVAGWRPAFGHTQGKQATSHLENQDVKAGDLFLFFGWFQQTKQVNGLLCYQHDISGFDDGFHAIFGYLEIDEKIYVNEDTELPRWLCDHPHAIPCRRRGRGSVIYIAKQELSFDPSFPGGGAFQFDEKKILTKKGHSRTCWNLNRDIFQQATISYHSEESWKDDGCFKSADRGQEFVIAKKDSSYADSGVIQWASNLIKDSSILV